MANDVTAEMPDADHSVWSLVHSRLGTMVNHAIKQTGKGLLDGLMQKLGFDITHRLDESLRHVAYGQEVGNDTVRHEVMVAVEGGIHDLNITDDSNSTFQHALVSKLDPEIELYALGKVFEKNTSTNWRAGDFFHQMPMKDETLFVSMVCMGVIVPIIIFTLCGIYFYKKKQENAFRREEMLLRDSSQFTIELSLDERTPEEHKGKAEEDVADLDFRNSYQA